MPPTPVFRRLSRPALVVALLLVVVGAQTLRPQDRIHAAITNARRTLLAGSRPPRARAQDDVGPMPAATRLQGITIVFNRSAAQQADLKALLAAQQNPAAAQYHQWLTPSAFGARFGMAPADLAKVEAWLQAQGFTLDGVPPSRDRIRFSGTVAQVEAAFAAPMHFFESHGVRHFAPAADLSLPSAIAPTVLAVRNLDDFRPHPRITRGSRRWHRGPSRREKAAKLRRAARPRQATRRGPGWPGRPGAPGRPSVSGSRGEAARGPAPVNQTISPSPHFTSSISGSVFFAPGDIATAYDVKPLYAAGDDGAGQTIAVIGQSAVALRDIADFRSAAGLTVKDPGLVLVPGSGSATVFSRDQAESDVDLEWAGAIAPAANLLFVYVGGNFNYSAFDALTYAVDQDLAPIISMSYGNCEAAEASGVPALESTLQQAAAQGQTVIAAAGDFGSTDCYGDTNLTTAQQQGLAVDYPASSAYVTGVGGTEIAAANLATGTGLWLPASSGQDVLAPALAYLPEIAWNDDSAANGISAGGGGAIALFAKPAWQTAVPGIPADAKRDVPDLALYASPSFPGYLYSTSDTSAWQSGQTASCNAGFRDGSTNDLTVAGGASFAAPIVAGMVAILNQVQGYTTGQGLINPTLYSLAARGATYAAAFHDVTTGNNDCTAGATDCASTAGFSAGVGYDQVTGLGSVNLNQLALAWPVNAGTPPLATAITVSTSNPSPALNASVSFTITVSSSSGGSVPTGAVSLNLDGAALAPLTLTANGTAVYTTSFAAVGAHQLLVGYSGDATHAPSHGVITVNVPVPNSGTGSFALAGGNLTLPAGGSGTSTLTVTPSGGYTGTVLLSFTSSNPTALANLCSQFAVTNLAGQGTVAVIGASAVTTQLTLDANPADCTAGAFAVGGRAAGRSAHPGRRLPPWAPLSLLALLLLGAAAVTLRRRAWLGLAALLAFGLAAVACGGGAPVNLTSTPPATPPAGTYTITVTGADSVTSTNTASTTFTFTIQ